MKRLGIALDPYRSTWRAARLLGGTLAAVCRKGGEAALPSFSAVSLRDAHLAVPIAAAAFTGTRATR